MANAPQRVVAVIPARYGSTRFPAKVLAPICGKPMVQWVYERTARSERVDETLVATDDERVAACVRGFGGKVALTSPRHQTGTDRIAEALQGRQADLILNVQGDEPLIPPAVLDGLVEAMQARPEAEMGTVAVPLAPDSAEFRDPNVVKCVRAASGYALYFTRAPAPHARDARPADAAPLRHWGIYAFRRPFFDRFVTLPRSPLERCESLEQLRALEHGARIFVLVSREVTVGVDVPADVAKVEALMRARGIA